ncbi:hypothetical protein [Streptomyces cavernicola]|uniref:Uncharacterized protein n=1 Tax=Streptomyces cavernicola TaxID=3043613 RepID=A0ABT6SFY3_9ACTN|nr:hypothetical protein [Streptomyces sp. B-S-A6]MDI3407080.1 hypothetical protein [Streptomyces sp. B-S-A6]
MSSTSGSSGRSGFAVVGAGRPADGEAVPGVPRQSGPTQFKAACPDCRARFQLAAGAIRLAIGASRRTTFYSFTCPECDAAVRKPAGERIVELLTRGGVRTLRLHSTV